jgi:hypothetical protein
LLPSSSHQFVLTHTKNICGKKSIIVARFPVIPLADDGQCGYITKLKKQNKTKKKNP